MVITYGNLAGPYYHVDGTKKMERLAKLAEKLDIADVKVWYDRDNDFHHLQFARNGKVVDVRYYKALSVDIDGNRDWSGAPDYLEREFVENIDKKTSLGSS